MLGYATVRLYPNGSEIPAIVLEAIPVLTEYKYSYAAGKEWCASVLHDPKYNSKALVILLSMDKGGVQEIPWPLIRMHENESEMVRYHKEKRGY